ncbi:unnamed protein product [Camellia sinensis]
MLELAGCGLSSLTMQGLASFYHMEILDLQQNGFYGSVPLFIGASSPKALYLNSNKFNGSLPIQGLCELKKLEELDLSYNHIEGILPPCLSNLTSLRLFDVSGNQFTGNHLSSLLGNLNSLEYIDLRHNCFEGLFSFSSFVNHSKLEVVAITSDNDKFEVETEYKDWLPMFYQAQVKFCYQAPSMAHARYGTLLLENFYKLELFHYQLLQ